MTPDPARPQQQSSLLHRISGWYIRRRYSILFSTLLVTFVVGPIAAEYHLRSGPILTLLTLNLGAAAFGMDNSRTRKLALGVVLATAIVMILGRTLQSSALNALGVALWISVAVGAAVGAVRHALQGGQIDTEHVSAALGAYLLVGMLFGFVYYQVEALRPGSISMGSQPLEARQFDIHNSIYFSFVTLATLGYGDFVPSTPTAKGLAITEAIIGQLYLAVLVARLVGASGKRR
jgi:voltage-gated potassium channel Kch